jgi:hypothetical protein
LQNISSLTNWKKKFHLDCTLQIKELVGFRATTSDLADDVSYVQVYCTEKNISLTSSIPGYSGDED